MNIKNIVRLWIVSLLLGVLTTACNKELDEAPILAFEGEANMTIAELNALHEIGSADSYDSIPAGTIISGVVISSDEAGNCYKYLNIQDETGGIQIKVDNSKLYTKYPIGQRIYVKCDGLQIGDYRKLPQLGFWENETLNGIPSSLEAAHLFRTGLPESEPAPILINSANDITPDMYNCLVKVVNCSFQDPGLTYADPNSNTSRDIILSDNSTMVLRNSNYATFAQHRLPEGTGNICGILTRYNNTIQLIIRSEADVQFGQNMEDEAEEIVAVDFSSNPIQPQGWSVYGDVNGWQYNYNGIYGEGSFKCQNTATTPLSSWLVSPTFSQLANYQNVTLTIQETIQQGTGTTKKYYTTTALTSDNVQQVSIWTEIPQTGQIPFEATKNPNFRIAFHYEAANSTAWTIKAISLKGSPIQ